VLFKQHNSISEPAVTIMLIAVTTAVLATLTVAVDGD
jgi:hypothetical protein